MGWLSKLRTRAQPVDKAIGRAASLFLADKRKLVLKLARSDKEKYRLLVRAMQEAQQGLRLAHEQAYSDAIAYLEHASADLGHLPARIRCGTYALVTSTLANCLLQSVSTQHAQDAISETDYQNRLRAAQHVARESLEDQEQVLIWYPDHHLDAQHTLSTYYVICATIVQYEGDYRDALRLYRRALRYDGNNQLAKAGIAQMKQALKSSKKPQDLNSTNRSQFLMTLNKIIESSIGKALTTGLLLAAGVGIGTGIIGMQHDPKGGYRAGAPIAYAGGNPEQAYVMPADQQIMQWMQQPVEQTLQGTGVTYVNDQNYQHEVFEAKQPVMVLFYGTDMGSRGLGAFVKVLHDQFPAIKVCAYNDGHGDSMTPEQFQRLKDKYGITTAPSLRFYNFKGGKIIDLGKDWEIRGGIATLPFFKKAMKGYAEYIPKDLFGNQ